MVLYFAGFQRQIADQLERLNANIEALVAELRALRERRGTEASIERIRSTERIADGRGGACYFDEECSSISPSATWR